MIILKPGLLDRTNSVKHAGHRSKFTTCLDMKRIAIAAKLTNGDTLIGQCEISHPGKAVGETATPERLQSLGDRTPTLYPQFDINDIIPRIQSPLSSSIPQSMFRTSKSSPNLTHIFVKTNLFFTKAHSTPLNASIRRIHYVNTQHQEIVLPLSTSIQNILLDRTAIFYGIGSLYTSLIPCLIVTHIAHAIKKINKKILILNGTLDRETSEFSALDFLYAICDALNYSWKVTNQTRGSVNSVSDRGMFGGGFTSEFPIGEIEGCGGRRYNVQPHSPDIYITHLVYMKEGDVVVDVDRIRSMGIKCVCVDNSVHGIYDVDLLEAALKNVLNS